jgi:hypothetical protein
MQNLKPMEAYKKEAKTKMSEQPEVDNTEMDPADAAAVDQLDMGDEPADDTEDTMEIPVSAEAPEHSGSFKPYMVITNLKKIADHANQLIGLISQGSEVEPWAVDHITTSADDVEEVYNYYKYKD